MRRYQLLDHTGDLKVEIYGRDLAELFDNAAFMLFDVMLDLSKVEEDTVRTVELRSQDLSELFLDWLRELLFLFSTQGFISKRVSILEISPVYCRAELSGGDYQPEIQGLKIEIKTPTYHQYSIDKSESGYKATVVLDV